jgi:hypothetical protein
VLILKDFRVKNVIKTPSILRGVKKNDFVFFNFNITLTLAA